LRSEDHVTLGVECVDRAYLNGVMLVVPNTGRVASFLRQREATI
jgi:hypothetical protein